MKNLSALLALRRKGLRPAGPVWIDFHAEKVWPITYGQAVLAPESEGDLPDLRPLLGLDVVIHAPDHTPYVQALFDRLTRYVKSIFALIDAYGPDIGFCWVAGYGGCSFDDLRWLVQFEDARKSLCKTAAETARRVELENESVRYAPWIAGRVHG